MLDPAKTKCYYCGSYKAEISGVDLNTAYIICPKCGARYTFNTSTRKVVRNYGNLPVEPKQEGREALFSITIKGYVKGDQQALDPTKIVIELPDNYKTVSRRIGYIYSTEEIAEFKRVYKVED